MITRRQMLILGAHIPLALAVPMIATCSSDDNEDRSGLLSKPTDSSKVAVRGGVLDHHVTTDLTTFDHLNTGNFRASFEASQVYSALVKTAVGTLEPADGSVVGDAAESWEVSPDGLQVTFALRGGLTFDPRPPTSGRLLDAGDVKFSFQKFAATGRTRRDLVNYLNPDAPLQGVETPDAKTVVFKLAFPYSPLLRFVASYLFGMAGVQPIEADGAFDPRTDMRGSGPWRLTSYAQSRSIVYEPNRDWYTRERPYLDGIDIVILPEYAQQLAQLKAGNLWTATVRPEDILAVKRETPGLLLVKALAYSRAFPQNLHFGLRTRSPFRDERVRRAVSMLLDRELVVEIMENLKEFREAGLPVDTRLDSHISAGEPSWIDPRGRGLGEGAKYFTYDPAEAKKLLRAAGHSKPIETTYISTEAYGDAYRRRADMMLGMLQEHGDFKLQNKVVPTAQFQREFLDANVYSRGDFDGIGVLTSALIPDPDSATFRYFHSGGTFPVSLSAIEQDSKMDVILERQRKASNENERSQTFQEFQRYAAQVMYTVPYSAKSLGFSLYWPWVGNAGVHDFWENIHPDNRLYLWLDTQRR